MPRRIASVVALTSFALAALLAPRATHAALTPVSATIQWTAPGDDSLSGTAARYDVRLSTSPIDASNFADATALTGAPAPLVAGSTQTMNVTGLTPATAYWCAIRTADEVDNWSGISNVIEFTTPASSDSIRPAPLALELGATGTGSVTLAWTATGDDSLTGTAAHYQVRWSTAAITPANFAAATLVTSGVPLPAIAGTAQGCTVTGLDRSVDLHFAARVSDEWNNWSALSNDLVVAHVVDGAPPASPGGLAAEKQSSGVHLAWSANTEPDLAGYHIYRAESAGGTFTRLDGTLLASPSFVDASAPDSASLWYAVSAVDATDNESARSAAIRVWLNADGIQEVRLQPVYPNPSGLTDAVTLPVAVPASGPVDGRIDIVNSAGERVRTLVVRSASPGVTRVAWDGRNDAGRAVAPGVYRALLSAGGAQSVVRLVRR